MSNPLTRSIPNTLTCLNLISGCVAVIMAFSAFTPIGSLQGWQWCCVMVGVAAVFDFLDGFSARLLKAYSKIGAELDSLSDLVSFGVAPGMLIFNIMNHYAAGAPALAWLSYAALLVPVFGALRLARFNVMDAGSTTFRGLPIPSCAIFLIGVAGWIDTYGYPGSVWIALVTVAAAVAMVGRFKMFSLKFSNYALHINLRRYVLIVACGVFVWIYGLSGLAWTIVLYLFMSVLSRREI